MWRLPALEPGRDNARMLARKPLSVPPTDEDLYRIGEENPGWKVERVDGGVRVTTP